jgi:hypothetical protein
MQTNKIVQIILIILCALMVLAGCAQAQPQGTLALPDEKQHEPTQAPKAAKATGDATVTISVDCSRATAADVPGAPESGWILDETEVALEPGDTVWDVLTRTCRGKDIAVSKIGTGASIFVKGIAGVAPVSAQSGWMFSVNGEYILSSAGNITLDGGEIIIWKYTMNSGDDL